ncbi:MAG: nucleotide disphospho-sugar-binding domain-containing protein [Acidimicrobiales bacterium]
MPRRRRHAELGALRYGLPLVCWPQGADQLHNARACEATGASVTVSNTAEAASGLRRVLDGESYRSPAQRLHGEVLAMPCLARCLQLLEELAG